MSKEAKNKAQEKAKELVEKYRALAKTIGVNASGIVTKTEQAKSAAIICVEEIQKFSKGHSFSIREDNDFWRDVLESIKTM